MASKSLSGSCACGSISYTSTSPPQHLDYCYCLTCQQISGAPFMAWMGAPKDALLWTFKNQPFIYKSKLNTGQVVAERTCCSICSCNIILEYYLYPEKTHVAASTMRRNDFGMPAGVDHIWTRHVPSWHKIAEDGCARYEEFDADFEKKLEEYLKSTSS